MHLTQNWEVRKPGASSRGGIVASQSRTAATVGAEVLAAGGAAVAFWDATIPPRDDTPGLRISQFCVRCILRALRSG